MKPILIALLDLYRAAVRPWLPASCRFYPSCADYARGSVLSHGALKGLALSALRISRCHPFHPGGHDPVPLPR